MWMPHEKTLKCYEKLRGFLPRFLFCLALGIYLGIRMAPSNNISTAIMSLSVIGILYTVLVVYNWLTVKLKGKLWAFLIMLGVFAVVPFLLKLIGYLAGVSAVLYRIVFLLVLVAAPLIMPVADLVMEGWFVATMIHKKREKKNK